ncbi:hypothetical protein B0H12DRAFT_295450 [Mycena haematopus]|nr:hypothetical protein B0H12DRAFT_295450 [Mycena haematopus]
MDRSLPTQPRKIIDWSLLPPPASPTALALLEPSSEAGSDYVQSNSQLKESNRTWLRRHNRAQAQKAGATSSDQEGDVASVSDDAGPQLNDLPKIDSDPACPRCARSESRRDATLLELRIASKALRKAQKELAALKSQYSKALKQVKRLKSQG